MKTKCELIKNIGWITVLTIALQQGTGRSAEYPFKSQQGQGLIKVQPWAQLMGEDKLGVGWLTSKAADGMVEWSQDENSSAEWKKAWYVEDGLRQANGTSQRAVIEGYDPHKPIRLRAVSRLIESFKPYKVIFVNPETSEEVCLPPLVNPEGKTSFAVFNDIHDRIENYPVLLDKAGKDLNFLVLNGDVLQDPQSEKQMINCLLKPMAGFTAQGLPCYFGRGNHETRGAFARLMKQYLCRPENRYYTAMTFGATRAVFLDSGEDKPDTSNEYSGLVEFDPYIEKELEWLKREIASEEYKSAKWRIVVVHIPPDWDRDEAELWHAQLRMNKRFAPIFDEGEVTAVISGHTHRMELIEPCPDKKRGFQWPVFIGGAPQIENAAVIRVDADKTSLKIRCIKSDGAVFAEKSWDAK